ncbi:ATP-binding protein [Pseudonocardia sp. ICBG1122]|nr:ATP-binding protein [Pseudonocardia pini]
MSQAASDLGPVVLSGPPVLVHGPAGCGRTTALDVVATAARGRGHRLLRLVSTEEGPLVASHAAAGEPLSSAASILMQVAGPVDTSAARRLAQAVAAALGREGRVLLVDDLHRADAGTMAVLRELIPLLAEAGIAAAFGVRTPAPERLAARLGVRTLRERDRLRLYRVPRLDRRAVAEVLHRRYDAAPAWDLVEDVWRRTRGLPVAVAHLADVLVRTDRIRVIDRHAFLYPEATPPRRRPVTGPRRVHWSGRSWPWVHRCGRWPPRWRSSSRSVPARRG